MEEEEEKENEREEEEEEKEKEEEGKKEEEEVGEDTRYVIMKLRITGKRCRNLNTHF